MPKILKRLVSQIKAKGKPTNQAYAIATAALQKSGNLKPGSNKPTAKGVKRGNMSPGARALDRESRKTGRPASDFKYKKSNNTAVLKPSMKRK